MKVTGVFFHEIFSSEPGPVIGNKFSNFPKVMNAELELPNVRLFKPKEVDEELLLEVHTPDYLENVKNAWYYRRARYSIGGVIDAAEKIWNKEIYNALVFNSAAGHHAGPSYGWGGTYLSCTGPAIRYMRKKYNLNRFVILDTDRHHGDGTRAIFERDPDVLHICFCNTDYISDDETKVDIDVGWSISDNEYLSLVEEEFKRIKKFKPTFIFHNFGHDTCQGDYGDLGLTKDFYIELAKIVKSLADEVCDGRYIIITHGGSRRDVAEYIFPRIIRVLSDNF